MSRMMSFKANDQEEAEIEAYKKALHFKDNPSFLRYIVFAYMEKHPLGAHHPVTGRPRGRPRKVIAGAKHMENGDNSTPRLLEAL